MLAMANQSVSLKVLCHGIILCIEMIDKQYSHFAFYLHVNTYFVWNHAILRILAMWTFMWHILEASMWCNWYKPPRKYGYLIWFSKIHGLVHFCYPYWIFISVEKDCIILWLAILDLFIVKRRNMCTFLLLPPILIFTVWFSLPQVKHLYFIQTSVLSSCSISSLWRTASIWHLQFLTGLSLLHSAHNVK